MFVFIDGECDMAPEPLPGHWAVFEMDEKQSVDDLLDAMDDLAYVWLTSLPDRPLHAQPAWFVYHVRKSTSLSALAPTGDLLINRLGE